MFVQRETLLRQLETNQLDMDATLEELCVQQETEDQNYEMYCLLLFYVGALLYAAHRGTQAKALSSTVYCTHQIVYCVQLIPSGEHQKHVHSSDTISWSPYLGVWDL